MLYRVPMRYYSTRGASRAAGFAAAALAGLAEDGGLFIPETIPEYRPSVLRSLGTMSFLETAFETIEPYVRGDIPSSTLETLLEGAFPFTAPLVAAGDRLVLELFHGPTAAFKDFGARFMARAFSWLRRGEDRPLHILVATSGDTGGAVADGFFGVDGISVTVLYPKGRVSALQEQQIAGLGGNISALAVEGSFDDCQRMVKEAFAGPALKKALTLSSANSINIARLLPQAVYYAAAAGKACEGKTDPDEEATPRAPERPDGGQTAGNSPAEPGVPAVFCVPSGNFGNLTAGLYAKTMGAPIAGFIAATNVNKTVPDYLETGSYAERPSQATISNAMDVGAPSNFERMSAHWNHAELCAMIRGVSVSDDETRAAIAEVYQTRRYYLDPHGAVAWKAADKAGSLIGPLAGPLAILATAHPAKFSETVEPLTGPVPVPQTIRAAMNRRPRAQTIPAVFSALREALLQAQ
jgi:threonine synthase